VLAALEVPNPASLKQYQEVTAAFLMLAHPGLLEQCLLPLLQQLGKGGVSTPSHILIATQAVLFSSEERQQQLVPRLACLLVPWTNHHTNNIRVFAQLGLCALLEAKPLATWPAWQSSVGPGGIGVLASLQAFYDSNSEFLRFSKSVASMRNFRPQLVTSPRGIFTPSLMASPGAGVWGAVWGEAQCTRHARPGPVLSTPHHHQTPPHPSASV
jgi:hypothetical protein